MRKLTDTQEYGEVQTSNGSDAVKANRIVHSTLQFSQNLNALEESRLSDNLELCLHQDQSRLTMLWGIVLEHFLEKWIDTFTAKDDPLRDRDLLEEWFKLAFDEQTISMHRLITRRTLEDKTVTLGQLTDIVYPPTKKAGKEIRHPEFNKKRRYVRDKLIAQMEGLSLWDVNAIENTDSKGNKRISKYEISAGPALRLYSQKVFTPERTRLLKALMINLEKGDVK